MELGIALMAFSWALSLSLSLAGIEIVLKRIATALEKIAAQGEKK